MSTLHPYDEGFFEWLLHGRVSAGVIAPLIADMVSPRSVVDVGCALGVWLEAFTQLGIDDVFGVDGDHLPREKLVIPQSRFLVADLTAPLRIDRRFEVLFSAAIPFQGGHNHVNEQWQEYWRAKFSEFDYIACDAIRPLVWGDDRVIGFYQQNMMVYVARRQMSSYPRLAATRAGHSIDLVHPWLFRRLVVADPSFGRVARALPRLFFKSLKDRLGRLAAKMASRR